eukprot:791559_1
MVVLFVRYLHLVTVMSTGSHIFALLLSVCIIPIVSQDIHCSTALACNDQSHQVTTTYIWGLGYHSLSGPNTSIHSLTDSSTSCVCYGAFTCNDVLNITSIDHILCTGSNSCYNLNHMAYITTIKCYGANSCSFSKLTTPILYCHGFNSCANSHIYGVTSSYGNYIGGHGAYSVQHSIIDSNNQNIDISFMGYYSGFNTTIKCHPNDQCLINCSHDACSTMYVTCDGTCLMNMTINPTYIDLLYHLEEVITKNDEECSQQLTAAETRDDYVSPLDYIGNVSICCRASGACISSGIQAVSTREQSVVCNANAACEQAIITKDIGPAEVLCTGYFSCKDSVINTKGDVYCLAKEACTNSRIYAINVTCAGFIGCWLASIHTQGSSEISHIYFLGTRSGYNAEIHCAMNDECYIFCNGDESCFNTTLICEGSCFVTCTAASHCPVNRTINPTLNPTLNPTATTLYLTDNPTLSPTYGHISSTETTETTATKHITKDPDVPPLFIALLVICVIIGALCGFLLRIKNDKTNIYCCVHNSTENKLAVEIDHDVEKKDNCDDDGGDIVEFVEMDQGMEGVKVTQEGVVDDVILETPNDVNEVNDTTSTTLDTKGKDDSDKLCTGENIANDEFVIDDDDVATRY